MPHLKYKVLSLTLLCISSMSFADEKTTNISVTETASTKNHQNISAESENNKEQVSNLNADDAYSLTALKHIRLNQLKIDAKANQDESIKDPLQPLNRKIYNFNMTMDRYVLRPVAIQYRDKVPEDVRGSYSNFRSNLREPWNAVNQVLQGRPLVAAKSLGRFTLNTVTSLGFVDLAKRRNLNNERDSFGTTLGVWGVNSGPYIMLPFLGPSTFRDTLGTVTDGFAAPQRFIFDDDKLYWTNNAFEAVDTRTQLLAMDDLLQGDQYATIRDAYLQQRAFNIANNRGEDVSNNMFSEDSMDDEFQDDENSIDQSEPSN